MTVAVNILESIFTMMWNVAWALCLGFLLSAVIQVVVSAETIQRQLGKTSGKSVMLATLYGAVSSSCSYAAASMSKSLFQKGASLTISSVFLVSSTNLVLEIMLVIWVLMGWQFVVGELLGGLVLVAFIVVLLPLFIRSKQVQRMRDALAAAEKSAAMETMEGGCGANMSSMEGSCGAAMEGMEGGCGANHAAGATQDSVVQRICSSFRMEVGMVGKDILIGLVIAAVLAALVPNQWWEALFMTSDEGAHPGWGVLLWNAIIGPLIAMLAFVCSVGNIVLASVLWAGGISFGGVMAFILADIITIPMIKVYASYYGWPAALRYGMVIFACIVLTALIIELVFLQAGMVPTGDRQAHVMHMGVEANYTSLLNAVLIPIAVWAWMKGRMG